MRVIQLGGGRGQTSSLGNQSRNLETKQGKLELDKLIFLSNAGLQTRVTKVRRVMPVRMTPFKGRCPDQSDAKRRRLVRPPETKRSGRREAAAAGATRDDEAAPVPKLSDVERDVHVFTMRLRGLY